MKDFQFDLMLIHQRITNSFLETLVKLQVVESVDKKREVIAFHDRAMGIFNQEIQDVLDKMQEEEDRLEEEKERVQHADQILLTMTGGL